MFVLRALYETLAGLFNSIIGLLEIVIVIRVILSWANADTYNSFVRVIYRIADPLLAPFQKLVPPWRLGGLDISPIFAFFTLEFIKRLLDYFLAYLTSLAQ
jgi:YggT family protein